MKTSNKLFNFKKVVAVGLSFVMFFQYSSLSFASENKLFTPDISLKSNLYKEISSKYNLKDVSLDELPTNVKPIKVNNVNELNDILEKATLKNNNHFICNKKLNSEHSIYS